MASKWQKFKVLNFMGMFACELDKNGSFKKMHWCKYFTIIFIWIIAVLSLSLGIDFLVMYKSSIDFGTLWKEMFSRYFGSTTTRLAIYGSIFLAYFKFLSLLISNFRLSQSWPYFWSRLYQFEGINVGSDEKVVIKSMKGLKRYTYYIA